MQQFAQYRAVLALDPNDWPGEWVSIADRSPAVAPTRSRYEDPEGSFDAYVFPLGRESMTDLANYIGEVRAAGTDGPYGGVAFVSERSLFRTNWEITECLEWGTILGRLQEPATASFVHSFATTGMELEFVRRADRVVVSHVDHEQSGGIEGSRGRLPSAVFTDVGRFLAEIDAIVRCVDELDARVRL